LLLDQAKGFLKRDFLSGQCNLLGVTSGTDMERRNKQ
jgi:hypothetical protein